MISADDYKHGVIWQDVQHQQLLDTTKKLLDSWVTADNDKESFFQTINFLKKYFASHFSIEEIHMKKYDYPEINKHLEEHRYFVSSFSKFVSQCIYSDKESAILLTSLNSWFFNHIMTTDKQLAQFLLKHSRE